MNITLTDLDGIVFQLETRLVQSITRLTDRTRIELNSGECIEVQETPEQISGKVLRRNEDEEFE